MYWAYGGKKLKYIDVTRAILEAPVEKVYNEKIGAASIEDLSAIWIFDKNKNRFVNKIEEIREEYYNLNGGKVLEKKK